MGRGAPGPTVTVDDPAFLALREGLRGRVLVGGSGQRYLVGALRSEGGQGWVFLATVAAQGASSLAAGHSVIVKVLRADALSHEGRVRFHREAQVLRVLSEEHTPCPHVVRFHDYSEHELPLHGANEAGQSSSMLLPFTVLEYVDGTSLDQELSASTPLALSRVRTILRHVAAGLDHVHTRGVVHRDLKPANILLAGRGVHEQAKITDFGLVRIVSPDLARTARIAGASVGYAPPEQYERGNARVSPRTDVFSLAAVAFEMLTGTPAYPYRPGDPPMPVLTKILAGTRPALVAPAGSPLAAAPDVVKQLEQIIHRALSPEPDARQASARELVDSIERQLARIAPPSQELPAVVVGRTSGPAPRWMFRGTGPRPTDERWKGAVFGPQGRHALVLGESAFYLVSVERILVQSPPSGLDMRALSGLRRLHNGALLVFGHTGVIGSVSADLGIFDEFQRPSHGVSFNGAIATGDLVIGYGKRARGGAAVVCYRKGRIEEELELEAPEILSAAVHDSGALVLGTRQGCIVRRAPLGKFVLTKLCEADLLGVACDNERVFVVGSGGHALVVDEKRRPASGGSVDENRKVTLEPVQTTRDLHLVQVRGGVAWAAGAEGRVVVRDGSMWVRADGASLSTGTPMALHVEPALVEVLWSDGAFTRGIPLEADA